MAQMDDEDAAAKIDVGEAIATIRGKGVYVCIYIYRLASTQSEHKEQKCFFFQRSQI